MDNVEHGPTLAHSDMPISTAGFIVVPTKYGPMIVNPLDQYIGRALAVYGEYSDLEVQAVCSFLPEGGVAFDIGANLGALTVPMARKVGPSGTILAMEPQRLIYNALCGTVALNDLYHVHPVLGAAGRDAGTVYVPTLHPLQALNFGGLSLEQAPTQPDPEGEPRPVYRLDDIGGFHRLDLIKVDVEGMENEVLAGAVGLIQKFRPIMFLENDRPHRKDELEKRIDILGYVFTWSCSSLYNPDNHLENPENIYPNLYAQNILCVPRERREEVEASHGVPSDAWVNP